MNPNAPWIWNGGNYINFIPKNNSNYAIQFGTFGKDYPFYCLIPVHEDINKKKTKKLNCMDYSDESFKYGWSYIKDIYQKYDNSVVRALCNGEFKNYIIDCLNMILNDPNFPKS